jgi:hypothetical protein
MNLYLASVFVHTNPSHPLPAQHTHARTRTLTRVDTHTCTHTRVHTHTRARVRATGNGRATCVEGHAMMSHSRGAWATRMGTRAHQLYPHSHVHGCACFSAGWAPEVTEAPRTSLHTSALFAPTPRGPVTPRTRAVSGALRAPSHAPAPQPSTAGCAVSPRHSPPFFIFIFMFRPRPWAGATPLVQKRRIRLGGTPRRARQMSCQRLAPPSPAPCPHWQLWQRQRRHG